MEESSHGESHNKNRDNIELGEELKDSDSISSGKSPVFKPVSKPPRPKGKQTASAAKEQTSLKDIFKAKTKADGIRK